MPPTRKIYPDHRLTDFLQYILYSENRSTTLLVCSARERFLEQLTAAIRVPSDETTAPTERHELLMRTIGLLAKSSKTKLVFCPTLEHLRAYMSVLNMATSGMGKSASEEQRGRSLLVVLNLLALHHETAEISAQGLSRTLAAAVEVTAHQGADLVLCEYVKTMDGTDSEQGQVSWDAQVPLLNQAARTGNEDSTSRDKVSAKRVAQRWFEFDDDRTI